MNEIGKAGQHADGGLGANGPQRGRQHPDVATLHDLGPGHQRTIAAVCGSHVPLDVRITND